MPACLYVYGITVVHLRPAVPVGQSQVGEPGQDNILLYAVILVLIVLVAILIVRQVM